MSGPRPFGEIEPPELDVLGLVFMEQQRKGRRHFGRTREEEAFDRTKKAAGKARRSEKKRQRKARSRQR